MQFEEERSGTIRWINFCCDEMRRERDEKLSWQFKGLPVHQWQLESSKFVWFRELSRKVYFRLRRRRFCSLQKHRRFESNLNPRMRYLERDVCCLPFPFNESSRLWKCFFGGKMLPTLFWNYVLPPLKTCLCGTERSGPCWGWNFMEKRYFQKSSKRL